MATEEAYAVSLLHVTPPWGETVYLYQSLFVVYGF